MWKIIRPDQDAQEVFNERLKRQEGGGSLDFLCIAVAGCGVEKHDTRHLDFIMTWLEAYREVEKAGIRRRMYERAQDAALPRVLPASIVMLIDPLPYLAEDTWEAYQKRAKLAESGVVLLKRDVARYGTSCEGDWAQFNAAVQSMLPSSPPHEPAFTGDPAQILAAAVHWQPTPLPASAAPFGRQPSHTELPDNDELEKMFAAYTTADRHDLDY